MQLLDKKQSLFKDAPSLLPFQGIVASADGVYQLSMSEGQTVGHLACLIPAA